MSTNTHLQLFAFCLAALPASVLHAAEPSQLPAAEQQAVQEEQSQSSAETNDFGFESTDAQIKDPLKPLNQLTHKLNITLDDHLVTPVAKGYQKVTPEPVQSGVKNFFSNLREPWTAVNLLLQGKPVDSAKSMGRFTYNTLTSVGFVDVMSKYHGVTTTKEDFGQTLATWGVPTGVYLVLPGRGPSTLRDTGGLVLDTAAYAPLYLDDEIGASVSVLDAVSTRAELLGKEGGVNYKDYEVMKSLYLQRRAYEVSQSGNPKTTQVDFGDQGFGD